MTKNAYRLIKARNTAPPECKSVPFDAWLLSLVLDMLEPVQRDCMDWLLLGNSDEPISTNDLCALLHTTPTRIGATLSRLRAIGLVKTTYRMDEHGRGAYHIAVDWVKTASRMLVQLDREAWAGAMKEIIR